MNPILRAIITAVLFGGFGLALGWVDLGWRKGQFWVLLAFAFGFWYFGYYIGAHE